MVMSPRDRRLQNDYEDMRKLADSSSMLSFTTSGIPPVHYEVRARCIGLLKLADRIVETTIHEFDLDLGTSYPLVPPAVIWRTPIFHPNINPPHVCTGNTWYAAMSLANYCIELCRLVQYQSFNEYDPLNQDAGLWLWAMLRNENPNIPVDIRPITDLDFEIGIEVHAKGAGGSGAGNQ